MMTGQDKRKFLDELPFFDPACKSGFVLFDDAKSLVMPLKLTSAGEYRKAIREGKLKRLPINPQVVYADSGWKGWDDYFGIRFTYEDALLVVRRLQINSSFAYKESYRAGLFPHGMPRNPSSFFGNRWGGWGAFLGCVRTFAEASKRVKDGLQRARLNGTKIGRPRVVIDVRRALELRESGLGYKQVAKTLGVPRTTIYRTLKNSTHLEINNSSVV
jgi:hypothetical protein